MELCTGSRWSTSREEVPPSRLSEAEERELLATVVVVSGLPLEVAKGGTRSAREGSRGVDLGEPS